MGIDEYIAMNNGTLWLLMPAVIVIALLTLSFVILKILDGGDTIIILEEPDKNEIRKKYAAKLDSYYSRANRFECRGHSS